MVISRGDYTKYNAVVKAVINATLKKKTNKQTLRTFRSLKFTFLSMPVRSSGYYQVGENYGQKIISSFILS